jgi:hypothetical protein
MGKGKKKKNFKPIVKGRVGGIRAVHCVRRFVRFGEKMEGEEEKKRPKYAVMARF